MLYGLIFQSAVVAAKGKIVLHLPTQYKLCVLQQPVVQQPVQLCPLCRGVAVFILDGNAVDGKGGAICEPGFPRLVSILKRQESNFIIVVSSKT